MDVFMKSWIITQNWASKVSKSYYIVVLYVIWYTDYNGSIIRCIEYTHLGHNLEWPPRINYFVCV